MENASSATERLQGYSSINATMIYTHVSSKTAARIQSLLNRLIMNNEIKNEEKNDGITSGYYIVSAKCKKDRNKLKIHH
jgi:hypothetical protein